MNGGIVNCFGCFLFRFVAIQNFQLNRPTAVELVDLRLKCQIEFTDGQRFIAAVPPNRSVFGSSIRHPHFDVLFLRAHLLKRFACDKLRAQN